MQNIAKRLLVALVTLVVTLIFLRIKNDWETKPKSTQPVAETQDASVEKPSTPSADWPFPATPATNAEAKMTKEEIAERIANARYVAPIYPDVEGAFGWKFGDTILDEQASRFSHMGVIGLGGPARPSVPHEFFNNYFLIVTIQTHAIHSIEARGPIAPPSINATRTDVLTKFLHDKYGGEITLMEDGVKLRFNTTDTEIRISYNQVRNSPLMISYVDTVMALRAKYEYEEFVKAQAGKVGKGL